MAFDDDEHDDKPVEEGETYEVDIEDLGSKGDGIARVDNFVVFVPDTEVGERVEVEINSVGRKFAFGDVVDRLGDAEESVEDDAGDEPAAPADAAGEPDDEELEEGLAGPVADEDDGDEADQSVSDTEPEEAGPATDDAPDADDEAAPEAADEGEDAHVEDEVDEEPEDAPGSIEDQF